MSLNDILKATDTVKRAADAMEENKQLILFPIVNRMVKAAEAYPEDATVVQMASFLRNRASKDILSISRKELKKVYNSLYTRNTKCGALLENELGVVNALPEAKKTSRDAGEGTIIAEAFENLGDPVVLNALNAAFEGKDVSSSTYSASVARSAEKNVAHELDNLGADAHVITTVAGQEDLLICQATYETPKGQSSVLIPVEVKNGKPLLPTMFLSRAGFKDLTSEGLVEHLTTMAGKKWQIDVDKLLKTVAAVKNDEIKVISEVEEIVVKTALSRGKPVNYNTDAVLYQQVDPEKVEVELAASDESFKFAENLGTTKGAAEFMLGKAAVNAGFRMVKKALESYGYGNSQISLANLNEDTMFFAVAVDGGSGFKVPVKIRGGLPAVPEVLIAGGSVFEFSEKGVSEAIESKDYEASIKASHLYDRKASELIDLVKCSMDSGDYVKAEEALSVLSQTDGKAFNYAFGIYQNTINGKSVIKEASADRACSMQVKNAHSKHILCGHTGLPTHKVYQDEHGDCHPLYRKNMDNTNEGGSFLHSRIYLG